MCTRRLTWIAWVVIVFGSIERDCPALAQSPMLPTTYPLLDDANLNDIQFVGSRHGWAVGERGVVWHTTDGGSNWHLVQTPTVCSLHSVSFLTGKLGWIAGGTTDPWTGLNHGLLLKTEDGGTSWHVLAGPPKLTSVSASETHPADETTPFGRTQSVPIPRLRYVRFFGPDQGVAVGESSPRHPTGVMLTRDGGQTWQPVAGERVDGWQTASFPTPDVGTVAGLRNSRALVGGGRLMQPAFRRSGLRGSRDLVVARNDTGWLVGDGGLVERTDNGGVVWREPPGLLPEEVRELFDFRTVAAVGGRVWIAGDPGSVVWHSPDGGRNWIRQTTGQTTAIRRLHFSSLDAGWAVGALGMILRTDDGGGTWRAVRGGGRRAALLIFAAHADRVPCELVVKHSGELGYRSMVAVPVRRDLGPDGADHRELETRLQFAVNRAGGNVGQVDWRFPAAVPGIDRSLDRLVADWNMRTEGRLSQVLLGRLVNLVRTWRPSVVVVDRARDDDALARLLNDAVHRAVAIAADGSQFPEQVSFAGLSPWQVNRVFQQMPDGSSGDVQIEPYELLPRVGTSIRHASCAPRRLLAPDFVSTATPLAWQMLQPAPDRRSVNGGSNLFAGLGIQPGSAARRSWRAINEQQLITKQEIVRRQRNFQSYVDRMADDPQSATQLIGELRSAIQDLPDEPAALQLAWLAESGARRNQWDLVESARFELVSRFARQPLAAESMLWLYQWYNGAEPAWQRLRKTEVGHREDRYQTRGTGAVRQAEGRSQDDGTAPPGFGVRSRNRSGNIVTVDGLSTDGPRSAARRDQLVDWQRRARRVAALLREYHPQLHATSAMQFSLAAQLRQAGSAGHANAIYSRFAGSGDGRRELADSEIRAAGSGGRVPRALLVCERAAVPPRLDGVLSDECWQRAREARLHSAGESNVREPYAFVLTAHDSDYLYLAGSIPRDRNIAYASTKHAGREYDESLDAFDRLTVVLDVDRDYATWYSLSVDQRGCTSDSCWRDSSWNPKWHVASLLEPEHWRVEVAIPFTELVPIPPGPRALWAIGIARTIPAVEVQSWAPPVASQPNSDSFGLLKFE